MLIRGHAEAARRNVIIGALLYDAMTVIMGIEKKDVKTSPRGAVSSAKRPCRSGV